MTQAIEALGAALVLAGVYLLVGLGPCLIVAGIALVLTAYGMERES